MLEQSPQGWSLSAVRIMYMALQLLYGKLQAMYIMGVGDGMAARGHLPVLPSNLR